MDSVGTNKSDDLAKIALSVSRALRRQRERDQELFQIQRRQGQFTSIGNVQLNANNSLPNSQRALTPPTSDRILSSNLPTKANLNNSFNHVVPQFRRYGAIDPSNENFGMDDDLSTKDEEKRGKKEKMEESENKEENSTPNYNQISPKEIAHVQFVTPHKIQDNLTPEEVLIQRLQQENDLEDLASNLTNELIVQSQEQSISAYWRSVSFKTFDGILRLLIIIMGIVVGILGNNIDSSNVDGTITLIVTIFGFVIPGISEFREQFAFKDRSVVLRKCYQDFNQITQELRILEVSGKETIDIIDELTKMRVKLDDIDMEAFNSQIVRTGEPRSYKTSKSSIAQSQTRNVVRPYDIPIFRNNNMETNISDDHQTPNQELIPPKIKVVVNKTPNRNIGETVSPYRLDQVIEDVSINIDEEED